ncbi:hypothetical protein SDC9_200254 [bioreactor metagenome]|uniref:Uncharacterized protein n=1 Tax=bioreactor metagenome TaxID=1076179 RepID=A0A645IP10_9ZZZZ
MHQNLIFNAPAGISGKADVFVRLKRRNPFDQPNGSNGNQVVLIPRLGVVFFNDVCHQTQVVLDKLVARLHVSGGVAFQIKLLLLSLQRSWEGSASAPQPQGEKNSVDHEQDPGS